MQNNVDIFVVQSPKELEDFIRIVKILTDILEYDQVRGLKNQKRVMKTIKKTIRIDLSMKSVKLNRNRKQKNLTMM